MQHLAAGLATLLLTSTLCSAQHNDEGFTCKNHDPALLHHMFGGDADALQRAQQSKAQLDAHTAGYERGGEEYVIPVVFHVIHQNGTENISDAQLIDAVRILNEDFNKENPDWPNARAQFQDRVADVGIRFRLAQRDPDGNCTNGITRTVSPLTFVGDYEMTQLIQWPREHYMNVWVGAAANGAAGYTNYPWVLDWSPESDGIVVQASYLGSIGTGSPSRSRVLTHEVGHWLNLMHCWGNSNDPGGEENCFEDDEVDDTPLTRGWVSCFLNGASCGSEIDNVENYMEYAYCNKMFTTGQGDRMIAALTSPVADRNELWQPGNLAYTGVDQAPELCAADFIATRQQICAGESVQFTDVSYNSVTERTWTFAGGEPATSSAATPTITYSVPGTYAVSLTVSDGTTTLNTQQTVAVEVLPSPGGAVPLVEGFETGTTLGALGWSVLNADGDLAFMLTSTAAASGTKSVVLPNGAGSRSRTDELLSGTYDLSDAEEVTLTFRHAFAQRQANNNDRLRVMVSNDCGATWSLRKQLFGNTNLTTAGTVTGNFVPDADEWVETAITNIGSSSHVADFRFKFQFTSDGGNNLYLDGINLNGMPVGLAEEHGQGQGLQLRPNPTTDMAYLRIASATGPVVVTLMDLLGRPAAASIARGASNGNLEMEIPVNGLARGVYLVQVAFVDRTDMLRLVVE